jgi:hypothetical protein
MKAHEGRAAPRLPTSQHGVQTFPHLSKVDEFAIQVSPLPLHQTVNV